MVKIKFKEPDAEIHNTIVLFGTVPLCPMCPEDIAVLDDEFPLEDESHTDELLDILDGGSCDFPEPPDMFACLFPQAAESTPDGGAP